MPVKRVVPIVKVTQMETDMRPASLRKRMEPQ